jgi:peptidoglycan/xylan/chitin deacetylase (PgdA/CDA1 family)
VKVRALVVAGAALALAACGSSSKQAKPEQPAKTTTHKKGPRFPDPKLVGANELGEIPVIMFHRVAKNPASEYDTTPSQFRNELRTLYRRGFRPISAADMVTGRINVRAGKKPVVLTFDDSSAEQFSLLPDGKVDPATAVGIMLAFARKHPGFTPRATFYVIASLFGGGSNGPGLLADLARLGFDLGNHTYDHSNLGSLDATGVQREIVLGERMINDAVPEEKVRTLALPYGVYPVSHGLALQGNWDGQSYHYQGVFEVGSGPAPSPYSIDFDPLAIPRIRHGPWTGKVDYGSGYWLHELKLHPEQVFVSDGNPNRISFPSIFAGAVAPRFRSHANPY